MSSGSSYILVSIYGEVYTAQGIILVQSTDKIFFLKSAAKNSPFVLFWTYYMNNAADPPSSILNL